jgi:hypothetical protein
LYAAQIRLRAACSRGPGANRGWRPAADLDQPNHRSSDMSKQKKAAQGSAAAASSKKFKNMNQSEKVAYVGKVFLFLLTFGFAYPSILLD